MSIKSHKQKTGKEKTKPYEKKLLKLLDTLNKSINNLIEFKDTQNIHKLIAAEANARAKLLIYIMENKLKNNKKGDKI